MKNKNNIVIGTKFYKYKEDGSLEVIRIARVKSENTFIVHKTGKIPYTITDKELHEYTLLRPDAVYNFAIVVNAEDNLTLHDVIVIMARKGEPDPYVICRQMMQNLFSQMVTPEIVLGSCISKDTCPEDVDFKVQLMCNRLVKSVSINGYLNDTPDDILSLAYKIIIQADKILDGQKKILKGAYNGLCSSVKELLDSNGFWQDVNKGLKIIELINKIDNCSLSGEQSIYLEKHISYLMDDIHLIKYDHDVDFTQIKSDYMLIRDSEDELYLLTYLRGSFVQQEHLSEEELAKFSSIKI